MYDAQLDNFADYNDYKKIEELLINYNNLKELAELGYAHATDIITDLDNAMNQIEFKKAYCLERCLIEKYTMDEIALEIELNPRTVQKKIFEGLLEIFTILSDKDDE